MLVDEVGIPRLKFLDEAGGVTYGFPEPTAAGSPGGVP